ncbi:cysteine protease ATG4A-like isoform X2 [Cuculus canorus]|uniref:cysteine protease ATG4A-like isoform X2 n=1 Tax=Cuculus canorus TaxID=55661 RepID=UPI0023AA5C3B|nr:cysteine protease ATG4A-like isoform X2 [Cuculus canorus]XP_053931519.1 cysteine protease ATG4A-like isoform X2 [Cuculus canorus]
MAQMGVGEGKSIGEWFGPNTVAQVLNVGMEQNTTCAPEASIVLPRALKSLLICAVPETLCQEGPVQERGWKHNGARARHTSGFGGKLIPGSEAWLRCFLLLWLEAPR